jgi:hypothetical protein
MTAPRSIEQLLDAFLADGLTRLPDRTYDAVRRDIHGLRQRGRLGRLSLPEVSLARAFSAAVLAVVVLAVAVLDMRPGGGPGGVSTPGATRSPAAPQSPSPLLSIGPPTVFASPLYGYSITVPAGWVSAPAVIRWDGIVEPGPFAETDKFAGPASLMAWAYAGAYRGDLAALAADRITATHRDHADTCPVIAPDIHEPLDIHGQSWRLLGWNCGALVNEAVTLRGDTAYVVVFRDLAVRSASDPTDRALFESMLESIVLPG